MADQTDLRFDGLELEAWRQFGHVRFVFHPQLTVLTGANATGKTTILRLLSQHFGWTTQFIGTPAKRRRDGLLSYLAGWRRRRREDAEPGWGQIGTILYSNGIPSPILVPSALQAASFETSIRDLQRVDGLFIPAHRPPSAYQPLGQIPTALPPKEQILGNYLGEVRNRFQGTHSAHSPAFRLKEALVTLATFGYGNQVVEPNPDAIQLFEGFQKTLRKTLPKGLGFTGFAIRVPEVVLETRSGDFSFDAVSGGIASIIDLTWQLFMQTQTGPFFTVLIDEPENHLHPELQRMLMPGFIDAFPTVQFIIATHNPLIVSSVPDSHVYALTYHPDRSVWSETLDAVDKAGSSNEILRDVLGLEAATPIWVQEEIQAIIRRYVDRPLNRDTLLSLRSELASVGLEETLPDVLTGLLREINDQTD